MNDQSFPFYRYQLRIKGKLRIQSFSRDMNNSHAIFRIPYCLVLFFLFTSYAYSNAGLPMIFIAFPAMVLALIPVIIIEAFIIHNRLRTTIKKSFSVSTVSNLVTTFAGVPITWLILVIIELIVTSGGRGYGLDTFRGKFLSIVVQAPWLVPYEYEFYWLVPAALLVLLVPFFFASWFLEYRVALKMLALENFLKLKIKRTVLLANLITYFLLVLFIIGKMLIGVK